MKAKILKTIFVLTFTFWMTGAIANNNIPTGMPVQEGELSTPYNPDARIKGVTILTEAKVPVYATADGMVRMAGTSDHYGTYVSLYHRESMQMSYYLFLSELLVESTAIVNKGDLLGYAGILQNNQTGLIYKVKEKGGFIVDPTPYLKGEFDN